MDPAASSDKWGCDKTILSKISSPTNYLCKSFLFIMTFTLLKPAGVKRLHNFLIFFSSRSMISSLVEAKV